MDNHSKLIKIYIIVCAEYEKSLQYSVQRFSNNKNPKFTDQEIMTIMLYGTAIERRHTIKEVYDFTSNYLRSWFPFLPSYVAFIKRLNRLPEALNGLLTILLENSTSNCSETFSLVDSMPIITCSAKRKAKVATEISDKGYCATKSLYYYGVKLHFLCSQVVKKHPVPTHLIVTPASESDLNIFREYWSGIGGTTVFADKAYQDNSMKNKMLEIESDMFSPVKYARGVAENIKQFNKVADDLYSAAVSSIRQPIESLFGWLIEKSDIQRASKVRSTNGLLIHIFNKLAACFLLKKEFNC